MRAINFYPEELDLRTLAGEEELETMCGFANHPCWACGKCEPKVEE